jgi:sulfite exporter TauE/SafE
MSTEVLAVAACLACPVAMCGGMMLMARRKKGADGSESSQSLDDLRLQHEQLGEEIVRRGGDSERVASLD